jgi:hypothetical protein
MRSRCPLQPENGCVSFGRFEASPFPNSEAPVKLSLSSFAGLTVLSAVEAQLSA